MNFVQQLEECLRDLAAEARKKHPGVKEASERATLQLRNLKTEYVSAVRQANHPAAVPASSHTAVVAHPTTRIFRSSDLLHPFLLAANYPNASDRLLDITFRAIKLILEADALVTTDAIHLIRVWMIQAQVVAGTYNKIYAKELLQQQQQQQEAGRPGDEITLPPTTSSSKTANTSATTSNTSTSSSSSWFSWGSSGNSNSAAAHKTATAGEGQAASPKKTTGPIMTSAAGSSTSMPAGAPGAASSSAASPQLSSTAVAHLDRVALDILSGLLQLWERLRSEPHDLTVEVWTHGTALACLWFPHVPVRHVVWQAARSTLTQMMSTLYQPGSVNINRPYIPEDALPLTPSSSSNSADDPSSSKLSSSSSPPPWSAKLWDSTWDDLLTMALTGSDDTSNSGASSSQRSLLHHVKAGSVTLTGVFQLCKKSGSGISSSPPSAELALELMTQIWKEGRYLHLHHKLMTRTMSVTKSLLEHSPRSSVEMVLRAVQWMLVLYQTQATFYPIECRELLVMLIKPIPMATEACRSHPDFEDGYVFDGTDDLLSLSNSSTHEASAGVSTSPYKDTRRKSANSSNHHSLSSFFPTRTLWKAGLVLEAIYHILEKDSPELDVLLADTKVMGVLAEAFSDLATLGASCRDHMLQVVDFCRMQSLTGIVKPALFHKAEQSIASGVGFTDESMIHSKGNRPVTILGEALWLAFQGLLRMLDCLNNSAGSHRDILEVTFAPCLSLLQHFLKRFAGSDELVELSLLGYQRLADACLSQEDFSMQRKALLTSLSKLSLPSWGKHDASCQLLNHHVKSLLCLLGIIHRHYEAIASEWDLIIWTFEELSVLTMSSPHLSDGVYHTALAIGAVYARFATFTTCFSDASLVQFTEALTEICRATMENRDVIGDSETILPDRHAVADQSDRPSTETGRETIGEKIMSMSVRAIYGGSNEAEKTDDRPVTERAKSSFYEEYRYAFMVRATAAKNAMRVSSLGRVPFVLALLADVARVNVFRDRRCSEKLSTQLLQLASATPSLRAFVMDVLTIFIQSHLARDASTWPQRGRLVVEVPMYSQLLAVEPIEDNTAELMSLDTSQVDFLGPLCESIRKTSKPEVALSGLGVLQLLLEGVGHKLNGPAWLSIIDTVASLSGDPSYILDRSKPDWANTCLMAFRCLKLIVNDFLEQLPSEISSGNTSLLDCCSLFASSNHDVNTSLTAIGLLWTIADHSAHDDAIDRTLPKLVQLSTESRVEVRNAAVNTLFSCIVGRGSTFSAQQWEACFSDTIFGVYDVVAANSDSGRDDVGRDKKASRYKVALHHTRDSASKQWLATQVLVLRGLMRVTRTFFSQLLESVEAEENEVPWFQDAWVKTLDIAFDAASQDGGRDGLDIRTIGVELLIVCCQLSSTAGIHACAVPAKVSTNMEVVNGALRSVRVSPSSAAKLSINHSHSLAIKNFRESLFLEAFESLECLQEMNEKKYGEQGHETDDTLVQLLNKFCAGLAGLYDCCKSKEFVVDNVTRSIQTLERAISGGDLIKDENDLERRFVSLVSSVLRILPGSEKHRYLNQAQRCALDLLRSMACQGSSESMEQLIKVGSSAFYLRSESEQEEIGNEQSDLASISVVNQEAATAVAEGILIDDLCEECKSLVLFRVLTHYLAYHEDLKSSKKFRGKRQYKYMLPVIRHGLASLATIENAAFIDKIWSLFLRCLAVMLSPAPAVNDLMKIPRISELLDILDTAKSCVPLNHRAELTLLLDFGASNSLEVAKQYALSIDASNENSDIVKKLQKQIVELVNLFSSCYTGACRIGPVTGLRSVTQSVLSEVVGVSSGTAAVTLYTETSLKVCKAMSSNEGTETLVIFAFPLLCKLLTSDDTTLRSAAGEVVSTVDISDVLTSAQTRCEQAEKRAMEAETQLSALRETITTLEQRNQQLQREVAVLTASAGF